MSQTLEIRESGRWGIYLILLLFSFFLLLFCGSDGWLRISYEHVDSSWFFMGGKAWMSGLTPYVDFTDSKGPLLWLIYGLGYLISPASFHGVFILEVISYWITFILLYKSARLVAASTGRALAISFLMAFFFFLPGAHSEIRAEDFNQTLNAGILYILILNFQEERKSGRLYIWLGVILGLSLMIKYNFTLVQAVPVLILLLFNCRSAGFGKATRIFGEVAAGFIIAVAPFLIYLWSAGALSAFFNEYFINTFHSVSNLRGFAISPWTTKWFICLFGLITLLAVWMPRALFKSGGFKVAFLCWFAASVCVVIYGVHEYYFNILGIFAFPGICVLISRLRNCTVAGAALTGMLTIFFISFCAMKLEKGEFSQKESAIYRNEVYKKINLMAKARSSQTGNKPTISYVYLMDRGEHIGGEMLPGTFYYAYQNGSTPEMHRRNFEDVFTQRPDFVVVDSPLTDYRKRLENSGYRMVMAYAQEKPSRPEDLINCLYEKTE